MEKIDFKLGDVLYMYTVKHGKLYIHEFEVIEKRDKHDGWFEGYYLRDLVKGTISNQYVPRMKNIGRISNRSMTIWMTTRDDESVIQMLVEYEEALLTELKKQINNKRKLIKSLKKKLEA